MGARLVQWRVRMDALTDKRLTQAEAAICAEKLWAGMTPNERGLVRFGMFPAGKMQEAENEGINGHALACALMDCAAKDGGMRA